MIRTTVYVLLDESRNYIYGVYSSESDALKSRDVAYTRLYPNFLHLKPIIVDEQRDKDKTYVYRTKANEIVNKVSIFDAKRFILRARRIYYANDRETLPNAVEKALKSLGFIAAIVSDDYANAIIDAMEKKSGLKFVPGPSER